MAVNRSIEDIIAAIRTAVFGKDVRTAIADGIEKCYDDSQGNNILHKTDVTVSQIGSTNDYMIIINNN